MILFAPGRSVAALRRLAALALIGGGLAGCADNRVTAAGPASFHREAQILRSIQAAGYTGPVLLTESTPIDSRGRGQPWWDVALPVAGVRAVRSLAPGSPQAARLAVVLQQAEITDPDQLDPGNNTTRAELNSYVLPSVRNTPGGARNVNSRIDKTNSFWSYNPDTDQWYRLNDGQVLDTRIRPRANAAGHYHGGDEATEARVGRVEPVTGAISSGVFANVWHAPEFAQEVHFEFRVRWLPPGKTEQEEDWFYSTNPTATRRYGLVRLPAAEQYDRVGGTATHPEQFNDWGDAELIARIGRATRAYASSSGDRTRVNDVGLMYGGRFDIGAAWRGSHQEHRGNEVDMRPIRMGEPSFRARFTVALDISFPSWIVEDVGRPNAHYHARSSQSLYAPQR